MQVYLKLKYLSWILVFRHHFSTIKGSQQYVIDEARYLGGENTNIFNHVFSSHGSYNILGKENTFGKRKKHILKKNMNLDPHPARKKDGKLFSEIYFLI